MPTSSPPLLPGHIRRCAASLVAAAVAIVTLGGCAQPSPPPAAPPSPPSAPSPAASPPVTTPAPVPPPQTPQPAAIGARVTWVTAADLGATWRPGCPVGPDELRRVESTYLGFDDRPHRGALVVHKDLVAEVVDILEELYALRYPLTSMRTVDAYPNAEDELSMADNNTSAFNCRGIPGSDSWSEHAFGRAIDLNPLLNPYIDRAGRIEPANAGPYVDRSRTEPGMLHPGDPAVQVFLSRGWRWGGDWRTPKDYQHFERP
ncbi:M15 family metallopeptidase [Mycolicibacterium sp. F2034L]|uniref:M15 family metallopeptidase n=1 Tax=Mycolicibacterium sp. F2034L TaxID=2926422 RepID=UPI001FF4C668|nr:M15 family metallopeptidase [Mycolicibacterium sp. F2034L]MCK0174176.1 M15 family metallopeptidase [Mycolicibacterium sp. F2034L]